MLYSQSKLIVKNVKIVCLFIKYLVFLRGKCNFLYLLGNVNVRKCQIFWKNRGFPVPDDAELIN